MRFEYGLDGLKNIPPAAVMTIGNFDGVHLGHRRLLDQCRSLAGPNSPVVAVTFEPHPLTRLRPNHAPPRLLPRDAKLELLAEAGADIIVELPPEPAVLSITARQFFDLLVTDLRVRHLVEGPDFNFGRGREGNLANLRAWAEGTAMTVHAVDEFSATLTNLHVVEVRSSLIRWLVAYGRVRDAAICLGRPYTLTGTIVKGFQRGRQLGMPTANFEITDQLIPADGVYAGRCRLGDTLYPAAVSIGTLPTFNESRRQVEAHLLGFEGDLYGQTLHLELIEFLRDQIKFKDIEQLKSRMWADIDRCRTLAGRDPAQPILAA